MTFMGRISYAFYLLHMPIAILMHKYFPWQGTVLSFLLGVLIWLVITITLSSFLELVVQPKIKYYLSTSLLLEIIARRTMAVDTVSIELKKEVKSN
jgi:peptidoglycan/LPS O-acetylase OafA/YrhL